MCMIKLQPNLNASDVNFSHSVDSKCEMSSSFYFAFNLSPDNFATIRETLLVKNKVEDCFTICLLIVSPLLKTGGKKLPWK